MRALALLLELLAASIPIVVGERVAGDIFAGRAEHATQRLRWIEEGWLDTPHGLSPDGFSQNACGNPPRSPPKGLPGPVETADSIARRARLNNTSGSSGAHPSQRR